MNETKEFIIWKKENLEDLEERYREYIKDCMEDKDFDIIVIETFNEWIIEEFDILKEEEGLMRKKVILWLDKDTDLVKIEKELNEIKGILEWKWD